MFYMLFHIDVPRNAHLTQFVVQHILHTSVCGELAVQAKAFGTTSALEATSGKAHVRNTPPVCAAFISKTSWWQVATVFSHGQNVYPNY